MPLYWLSFVDGDRPRGERFLGVAIVEALNEFVVIPAAWAAGVNPGGEVQFVQIPNEMDIPIQYINRLMDKDEIAAFNLLIAARESP